MNVKIGFGLEDGENVKWFINFDALVKAVEENPYLLFPIEDEEGNCFRQLKVRPIKQRKNSVSADLMVIDWYPKKT